jgi:hypothetical protein
VTANGVPISLSDQFTRRAGHISFEVTAGAIEVRIAKVERVDTYYDTRTTDITIPRSGSPGVPETNQPGTEEAVGEAEEGPKRRNRSQPDRPTLIIAPNATATLLPNDGHQSRALLHCHHCHHPVGVACGREGGSRRLHSNSIISIE